MNEFNNLFKKYKNFLRIMISEQYLNKYEFAVVLGDCFINGTYIIAVEIKE